MPQSEEKSGLVVTREILADMLLVTPHEVNNLWKHHGMPKEARGQYDLLKVIPFMVRRLKAQIKAAEHGDLTKVEAERQLTIFNMELVRIELAEKQRVTLNADDVERALTPAMIATAKKLDALTRDIRATFPKDEPPEVRKAREEKLEKLVAEMRQDLEKVPLSLFGERPAAEEKKETKKPKNRKGKK